MRLARTRLVSLIFASNATTQRRSMVRLPSRLSVNADILARRHSANSVVYALQQKSIIAAAARGTLPATGPGSLRLIRTLEYRHSIVGESLS